MACSTFKVSPRLSVLCFRREGSDEPYFVVREFDTKVIRSPSQHKKGRGPSEQAIRASIRQAILNMSLKSERATKLEIRQLKAQGILGKRAPSCSLLNADDMIRLLEAFGKHSHARELRIAMKKENNFSPIPMRMDEIRPRKRRQRSSNQAKKKKAKSTSRLDALLFAVSYQTSIDQVEAREAELDLKQKLWDQKVAASGIVLPPVSSTPVHAAASPSISTTEVQTDTLQTKVEPQALPEASPSPVAEDAGSDSDLSSSTSPRDDADYQKTPEDDHNCSSPSRSPDSPVQTFEQAYSQTSLVYDGFTSKGLYNTPSVLYKTAEAYI